jgi:hypothetical protein
MKNYQRRKSTIQALILIMFSVFLLINCQGDKSDDVAVTEIPITPVDETTPNNTTDSIVPDDPEEEPTLVEYKTFNVRNLQADGCRQDGFQLTGNLAKLINDDGEDKILWLRNPGFPYSNTSVTSNEVPRPGEIWVIENGDPGGIIIENKGTWSEPYNIVGTPATSNAGLIFPAEKVFLENSDFYNNDIVFGPAIGVMDLSTDYSIEWYDLPGTKKASVWVLSTIDRTGEFVLFSLIDFTKQSSEIIVAYPTGSWDSYPSISTSTVTVDLDGVIAFPLAAYTIGQRRFILLTAYDLPDADPSTWQLRLFYTSSLDSWDFTEYSAISYNTDASIGMVKMVVEDREQPSQTLVALEVNFADDFWSRIRKISLLEEAPFYSESFITLDHPYKYQEPYNEHYFRASSFMGGVVIPLYNAAQDRYILAKINSQMDIEYIDTEITPGQEYFDFHSALKLELPSNDDRQYIMFANYFCRLGLFDIIHRVAQ